VSLSSGDEVPHIFTRKSRLKPGEFLITSAKGLLQQNRHKAEVRFCCGLRPLSDQLQTQIQPLRKATRSHIKAYLAILVLATTAIIYPIAVADIEAALAAVPPDCVLDEPGKDLRV
jgi:hypothetical protein